MDGGVSKRSVGSIDTPDNFIDLPGQLFVLLHLRARRNTYLQHDNFSLVIRIFPQEYFERQQFVWHSFDIVDSIDAQQNFHAFKLML